MSESLNKSLVIAAEHGRIEEVANLLEKGTDPNAMGPNSGALHCAAFSGHIEIVSMLLDKGADPQIADQQSFFPLHLAASKGRSAVCETLVRAGAGLEAKTGAGGTALHVAAASGYKTTVSALLKAGADIEARDKEENTPLHVAAGLGETFIVSTLLKGGADINARNKYKETPLIRAIEQLKASKIDKWISEGTNGGKPVKYEVVKGCFTYTADGKTKILSLKDQRYCASQSWGPQQHLKYLNALDIILLLIKKGADIHAVNIDDQTPLSIACHSGEAKVIKALHAEGAKMHNTDWQQGQPIHYVAGSGRLDGLKTYLKLTEEVKANATDEYGWTPMHYLADVGGDIEMVKLLLKAGADLTLGSTKLRGKLGPGTTPKDVALHWKDEKMAAAMEAVK